MRLPTQAAARLKSLLFCSALSLLLSLARSQGDYFLFVRQWDPTVCRVGNCSHAPGCRFTIHGLWPQYFNDTWPQFCTGEGFDPSLVADLEPVLRREWPSVFSSNAAFWKHEWRKHGTCAEGLCQLLSDEHSFFFAVLALNKLYDPNTVVDRDISLETPHAQKWVEDTFAATFNYRPAIHCYHEHHSGHGKSKKVVPVYEVWMCFSSQLQPFTCPENVRRRCNGDVIFPSLDPGEDESVDAVTTDDVNVEVDDKLLRHSILNDALNSHSYAPAANALLEALEAVVEPEDVLKTLHSFAEARQEQS